MKTKITADGASIQSNLVLTTAAITFLIYEMTAVQTMQNTLAQHPILKRFLDPNNPALHSYSITHALMNLNHAAFVLSAVHYFFALAVSAYGLYYMLKNKKGPAVVAVATFVFIAMLAFNELYLVSSLNTGTFGQDLVVGISSACISLALFAYMYKQRKALSMEAQLAFGLLWMGVTMLAAFSLIVALNKGLLSTFAPLNIALTSSIFAVLVLFAAFYKHFYKHQPLENREKFAIGMTAISLLSVSFLCYYWTFKPDAWSKATQQILNITNNYVIFFYAALVAFFTAYRLSRSLVKLFGQKKVDLSWNAKQYCFYIFSTAVNTTMDLLFLYFCVFPMVQIALIKLSMPDFNARSIRNPNDPFRQALNKLGHLSSPQTQICVLVFTILLLTRLILSVVAPKFIAPKSDFFYKVNQIDTIGQPEKTGLTLMMLTGLFTGCIGIIADKLIWNFDMTNSAAKVVFWVSAGILALSAILLGGMILYRFCKCSAEDKDTEVVDNNSLKPIK